MLEFAGERIRDALGAATAECSVTALAASAGQLMLRSAVVRETPWVEPDITQRFLTNIAFDEGILLAGAGLKR